MLKKSKSDIILAGTAFTY